MHTRFTWFIYFIQTHTFMMFSNAFFIWRRNTYTCMYIWYTFSICYFITYARMYTWYTFSICFLSHIHGWSSAMHIPLSVSHWHICVYAGAWHSFLIWKQTHLCVFGLGVLGAPEYKVMYWIYFLKLSLREFRERLSRRIIYFSNRDNFWYARVCIPKAVKVVPRESFVKVVQANYLIWGAGQL